MRIRAIISAIESFAPPSLQENWDNTGLQVGNAMNECTGVLICLDVTEDIISEAVEKGCNLVVSHHPLIFKGVKQLTGKTPEQCAIIAAIKCGVTVYSTHTALDSTEGGISYEIARKLGLDVVKALEPKKGTIKRVTAYVPRSMADDATLALLDSGFQMTLNSELDKSELHETNSEEDLPVWSISHEPLTSVTVNVPSWNLNSALTALNGLSAGEKMTVNVSELSNENDAFGLGVLARVPRDKEVTLSEFVENVKRTFAVNRLRLSSGVSPDTIVRTVALCGGSGGEFIPAAIRNGADVYISADIRYHDFCTYSPQICIVDIGHFESEICAKDILYRLISKKIPNFAVYKSELEKNPVNYL